MWKATRSTGSAVIPSTDVPSRWPVGASRGGPVVAAAAAERLRLPRLTAAMTAAAITTARIPVTATRIRRARWACPSVRRDARRRSPPVDEERLPMRPPSVLVRDQRRRGVIRPAHRVVSSVDTCVGYTVACGADFPIPLAADGGCATSRGIGMRRYPTAMPQGRSNLRSVIVGLSHEIVTGMTPWRGSRRPRTAQALYDQMARVDIPPTWVKIHDPPDERDSRRRGGQPAGWPGGAAGPTRRCTSRKRSRWPGRACAAWQRSGSHTTAITGYPPVTGWSARNSTGCPFGGTCRAPQTVPSDGSSRVTERSSVAPDNRIPTRLLCVVTL